MEKLNIAELLKDCPKDMELDCLIYEDVYFDYVDELNIIHCYIQHETHKTSLTFNQYGIYNSGIKAKCVIFPKDKTTWEGFQRPFKDGDIVYTRYDNKDGCIFIFESITENTHVNSYLHLKGDDLRIIKTWLTDCDDKYLRHATEEEKEKLFQAIKDNGYHWNAETKTLEKLIEPKFKVGDMIQDVDKYKVKITEVNIEDECYGYESMIAKGIGGIPFKEQNNWELVPNKFDITTLKPFDKVLVRCGNNGLWDPQFFAYYRLNSKFPFTCTYNSWSQCVPYEGNEHLLGTTNDCDEFYKNW